jgi:hypothetical protein
VSLRSTLDVTDQRLDILLARGVAFEFTCSAIATVIINTAFDGVRKLCQH